MKMKTAVKAILSTFAILIFFNTRSRATTFTVMVSNFQFSPTNIPNVVVGDVIKWVWDEGVHTTTCDPAANGTANSLPAGAPTWDAPITSGNQTFSYTVTVAGNYKYWCTIHGSIMPGTFTASDVLPIKLSTFKVANENNDAVLNWETASEDNIDYFSIQKSKTGSDFTEIARIPAAGYSSSIKSYSYTDKNSSTADKFYYYMLAIVDKEGKKELSPVQLYRNKVGVAKLILSISPNPVSSSGHLMLKFNADKAGKMDVKVASMEGKYVIHTAMQATEGVNNGHLMLGGISPGSYSIIFQLNDLKEVYELIIK